MQTRSQWATGRSRFWMAMLSFLLGWLSTGCEGGYIPEQPSERPLEVPRDTELGLGNAADVYWFELPVEDTIRVKEIFPFLDTLVARWNTLVPYELTEHLLVRSNPYLIERLENTDYYWRKENLGEIVYDQRMLPVLFPGDRFRIPSPSWALGVQEQMRNTVIDVNIPEFRIRIIEYSDTLHTFPVRVGQYRTRYLELAKHDVDLRTAIGKGEVVRIARTPLFINPVDGERFDETCRDDGQMTKMPLIPWIEPAINGLRPGHLIHPTTNPRTLERAYSNGCVGVAERAAWRIYYYAPVGTRVNFRYDLRRVTPAGDTLIFKDIYDLRS
jgi:hypothetical protein